MGRLCTMERATRMVPLTVLQKPLQRARVLIQTAGLLVQGAVGCGQGRDHFNNNCKQVTLRFYRFWMFPTIDNHLSPLLFFLIFKRFWWVDDSDAEGFMFHTCIYRTLVWFLPVIILPLPLLSL
jgi:hypothetical protein